MEAYICLPNLLAGGLPAGALAASIASHTLQTQNTHTLQTIYLKIKTIYLKIKNTTQHTETEVTMGGRSPPIVISSFCVCCVVFFIFKYKTYIVWSVCVFCVWSVCVGVVPRVCEAMEAASAPAGKPPAKRLGKQIYVSIKSLNYIISFKWILYIKPSLLSTNVGFYCILYIKPSS